MIICLLVGCKTNENNNLNNNQRIDNHTKVNSQIAIDVISPSDEEYSILKAAGTKNSMVFQINLGNVNVHKINYWMDHYVDGALIESLLKMGSQVLEQAESKIYKLYLTTTEMNPNQEIWTLVLRENGNVSSVKYENKNSEFNHTVTHPITEISTGIDEITDLGMIIINKEKNQIATSNDIKRTIEENKEVYVLRCKFD